MTHEYTILVGGVVVRGGDEPAATAIAWAEGTILAIGTDAQVLAISRGDSHVVALGGARVAALDPVGRLEVGAPADILVEGTERGRAVIRGGRLADGLLPELDDR